MGGLAIKTSSPVPGDKALRIYLDIENLIKSNINGIKIGPLGSTGKKPKNEMSGDIDVALEMDYSKRGDIINIMKDYDASVSFAEMPGNNIVSFGWKWAGGIVQVDFMFVNSLAWATFAFHSPNYIKKESKYKGKVRNILISTALKYITIPGKVNTYTENGERDIQWIYTFYISKGIRLVQRKCQGSRGTLKSPKVLSAQIVSNDPYFVTQILFGDRDLHRFNTAEILYKDIMLGKSRIPENLLNTFSEKLKENLLQEGVNFRG